MRKTLLSLLAALPALCACGQLPYTLGGNPGLQQLPDSAQLNGSDPGLQQLPRGIGDGVGPVRGTVPAGYRPSYPAPYPGQYRWVVAPEDFQRLLSAINAQTFASEQLPMVEAAGLCGWFTCRQCADLMQIFDFDDNRLQALRYIAPHLVDPYHWWPIMNALTFDSSRQTARNIISSLHSY